MPLGIDFVRFIYSIYIILLQNNGVNTAYDNLQTQGADSSGSVSIKSQPDFMEKLRAGINNIDAQKIKMEFEYEIAKLKGIFSDYKTNE